MSLTENSDQVFLPGGCNKHAKLPIYISLAPRPLEIMSEISVMPGKLKFAV